MLFRMLVLMSIYSLIMSPLTYLMNVDAGVITEAANALKEAGIEIAKNTRGQGEIQIINAVLNGTISSPEILEAAKNINFNLFGLNLTETPKFSFNIFGDFQAIWLMPIFSFASQMLVSFISTRMQKKANPDAPNMTGMLLMMPLFSLYIGFLVPGGVSFYWVCSSLIGGLLQVVIQHVYGPQRLLAGERAKELAKQCDFEAGQIKKLGTKD